MFVSLVLGQSRKEMKIKIELNDGRVEEKIELLDRKEAECIYVWIVSVGMLG